MLNKFLIFQNKILQTWIKKKQKKFGKNKKKKIDDFQRQFQPVLGQETKNKQKIWLPKN